MSVIFGRYNLNKYRYPYGFLVKMESILSSWKPDDKAIWYNDYIGFGHLMLRSTPESLHEKQPFRSLSSGNIITTDSRIDNRDELFTKLNITDHSISDAGLILATYDKYGENCVSHLIGDFVFAIWDVNRKRLFLARDHMGIRPLFYYFKDNLFIWSSTLKGLSELPQISKEIDVDFVHKALCLYPNKNEDTCYKHIKKLSPGEYALIEQEQLFKKRYWSIRNVPKEIKLNSEKDYIEQLRFLFEQSINRRLRTNFGVGCQLSGGLDSASITSVAFKNWNNPSNFHTFTHALPSKYHDKVYPYKDERHFAQYTINKYNIKNTHFVHKEYPSYLELLKEKIDLLGGVFDLSTEDMILELAPKASSNNIRTVFSGFLGDSGVTFRANNYQLELFLKLHWKKLHEDVNQTDQNFLKWFKIPLSILKIILSNVIPNQPNKELRDYFSLNKEYIKDQFWQIKRTNSLFARGKHFQLLDVETRDRRFLLEGLVGKEYGFDMCYPMADKDLLEFSIAMPIYLKTKHGVKRYAFREAVKEIIPNEVLFQSKQVVHTLPLLHSNYLKSREKILNFLDTVTDSTINIYQLKEMVNTIKAFDSDTSIRHPYITTYFPLTYLLFKKKYLNT